MNIPETLGYIGSPCYLTVERDFPDAQELSYEFRKATAECGLKGVYALRGGDGYAPFPRYHESWVRDFSRSREFGGPSITPVVYFCHADSSREAGDIHRRVWNQGTVPFLIIQTPEHLELYSGFRYTPPSKLGSKNGGMLKGPIEFSHAMTELAAFQAASINDGTLWDVWGKLVTPETRVDWTLLDNLEKLDGYLRDNGISRNLSHAFIGKFVYFRYLRDRKILSNRKLEKWGIASESVFSRDADLASFLHLDEKTHKWLNGSIFPVRRDILSSIGQDLFQQVAGVFNGDTVNGQLHLNFQPYDFSFIPIETLSVIYEQFLHAPEKGKATSRGRRAGAYFTPIPLVGFIHNELEIKRPLSEGMKILDPSCGSGTFLVQCFRRLIERQIRNKNRRLWPSELRDILTTQIFGIDRDGDACRVAELSLMLTLLDYISPPDLENHPTFALPSLKDVNVFEADFFDPDSSCAGITGSSTFDWVVGNPPWIELGTGTDGEKDDRENTWVWQWMQNHNTEMPVGGHQVAEAFAWKILPCLKPDGVSGLVLPAMTLFKKESTAFRRKFFAETRSWCVANFSNLSEVLFSGRARQPAVALFFQPPSRSEGLEDVESMLVYAPLVINQEASRPRQARKRVNTWNIVINASEIQEMPVSKAQSGDSLPWKIAMWGSFRDAKLLTRMRRKYPSFGEFCKANGLRSSQGVELRENLRELQGKLMSEPMLAGKKRVEFNRLRRCGRLFVFPDNAFEVIQEKQCYIPTRSGSGGLRVSEAPHIILDVGRRFAVYSDEFIVIPARQIGIAGPKGTETLLKALSVYLSSDFVTYQQFFTASQWGISKSIATLAVLKELPLPLDNLTNKELKEWADLRDNLANVSRSPSNSLFGDRYIPELEAYRSELNRKVFQALGARESEKILIQDFVRMNQLCIQGKVARETNATPSGFMRESYVQRLKGELDGFIGHDAGTQHEVVAHYESRYAIIAIRLTHENLLHAVTKVPERVRERFQQRYNQWMYFNRSYRVFDKDTLYCLKPLQAIQWTERQAILDAGEVIAATLAV